MEEEGSVAGDGLIDKFNKFVDDVKKFGKKY